MGVFAGACFCLNAFFVGCAGERRAKLILHSEKDRNQFQSH